MVPNEIIEVLTNHQELMLALNQIFIVLKFIAMGIVLILFVELFRGLK